MDDVIIFPPDVKTYNKVLKSFMFMLKKYGMLLTINKVHTLRSKVKYMGLLLLSKDNLPTITALGSRIKAISMLPTPTTVRGIKSFIGCVIYLALFLPKLSELIKPINDILKKCTKVDPANTLIPLPVYAKGKGKGKKRSLYVQKYWMPIHTTNFDTIKSLIVQAPILLLPACTCRFYLEWDSSAKHGGSVLYQIQNGSKHVIAFYSATMPNASCRYSSSELELCGLKKSLLKFQYLLKYSTFTFLMDHGALKHIYCSRKPATHTCNLQDNVDLTHRTAPTRPANTNIIPQVNETLQSVNMDRHFPHLLPLSYEYSKDLQLKICRDVPHQKLINKIVDQLNSKTIHFYNLPFSLDTLRKA